MFLWDSIRGRFGRASVPDSPLFRSPFALVDDSAWRDRLATGDASLAQVYADWLEEQGDGRAELMRRAASGDALEGFLTANAAVLLGPLSLLNRSGARAELELKWEAGLLRSACVRPDDPEHGLPWDLARLLMQGPIGKDLRSLSIGISQPMNPLTSSQSFEGLSASLTCLFIGDSTPDECEMSWAELGDVSGLWAKFPRLESLKLRGSCASLGPIVAGRLRELTLETTFLTRPELDALSAAHWPMLERLELWVGDAQWALEAGWSALHALLERPWPRLTSLAIRNCIDADLVVEWLVGSRVLPQLERLDLSLGALSDSGAERLLAARAQLAHLASIDLSANELSPRLLERLLTLAPIVYLDAQRWSDTPREPSVVFQSGE